MLLRATFSKARALLKETIHGVKSLLSGGYQRLPKPPPISAFSCATLHSSSFRDLDNSYSEEYFSHKWEGNKKKKKRMMMMMPMTEGSFTTIGKVHPSSNERRLQSAARDDGRKDKMAMRLEEEEAATATGSLSRNRRMELCCKVEQGLKELELLDASNMEHLLDIEELMHCYSRIKCPFYLDIFNKFFMEMYSDFLPQPQPFNAHLNRRTDSRIMRI